MKTDPMPPPSLREVLDWMVERLARVLAEVYHGRPCEDAYVFGDSTGGSVFVRQARAAIGAMLEPTERVWRRADIAIMDLYLGDGGFCGEKAAREQARVTWRAMIDATREALSVCEQERDVDRVKYREALADMIDAFDPWTGMTDKQERAVKNARRALGGSDADV